MPDDVLNSLLFDRWTNNIVVGSRKINFWFFKTQEEIKTSHEFSVVFALFNTNYDSIVSGDDQGYISVWDIENGTLISKFSATSPLRPKITAGCFDST
jgi:WD40 repeat protein